MSALGASERPASVPRNVAGDSSGSSAIGTGDEGQKRDAVEESGEADGGLGMRHDSDSRCAGKEEKRSQSGSLSGLDCEVQPAQRR
jgi:hypothetical protein